MPTHSIRAKKCKEIKKTNWLVSVVLSCNMKGVPLCQSLHAVPVLGAQFVIEKGEKGGLESAFEMLQLSRTFSEHLGEI